MTRDETVLECLDIVERLLRLDRVALRDALGIDGFAWSREVDAVLRLRDELSSGDEKLGSADFLVAVYAHLDLRIAIAIERGEYAPDYALDVLQGVRDGFAKRETAVADRMIPRHTEGACAALNKVGGAP